MKISVDVSQSLSSIQTIEVPDDFEYDPVELEKYVREQIVLPSDCLEIDGYYDWIVDEFTVL